MTSGFLKLKMKKSILLFFLISALSGSAQKVPTQFSKLSCPLKTWVILHPFKAKRAQLISREAYRVSDSIKRAMLLDGDGSGGQVDAFRHGYWLARLHQEIGKKAAISLGKAHEKSNKIQFKNRILEDGTQPDQIASEMDLHNNEIGASLISKNSKTSKIGLMYRVINAIHAGDLKVIKKDQKGRFLNCNGTVILTSMTKPKWENEKCLVPSNQSFE